MKGQLLLSAEAELLQQMLSEQQKTNQLLCLLIDALSEGEDRQEPTTYLDGSSAQ